MTTRRNFLKNILVAGASFTILPGAGRLWRAERQIPINAAWQKAFAERFFFNTPIDLEVFRPLPSFYDFLMKKNPEEITCISDSDA